MATLKNQNIAGVILFVIGTAVLWLVAENNYGDFAYQFGTVIARSLIFTAVIMLILIATPYRKKVSASLVVGIMYFLSVGMVSFDMYEHGEEQRQIFDSTVEVYDAVKSGDDVSKYQDKFNKGSIGEWTANYALNVQRIRSKYDADSIILFAGAPLSPENLTNIEAAKQTRAKAVRIIKEIPSYEAKLIEELNRAEQELSERKDADSRAALEGFRESKDAGAQLMKDLFDVQKRMFVTVIDVIDFAIEREGELYPENGQLIFKDQESLDLYNGYLARLGSLAEEEARLMTGEQERINDLKSQMK